MTNLGDCVTPSPLSPNQTQADFLASLAPASSFHHAFDGLRDVAFFAKDHELRFIACSENFYRRFGFQSEAEILGRCDADLVPPYLLEHFMSDDREVIRTGQPKRDIVEVFLNDLGVPDWYLTHKMPLFDRDGRVIGVMGTTQPYQPARESGGPDQIVEKALRFIQQNYRSNPSVQEVADFTGISSRQLHRKFIQAFGSTPKETLRKLRVRAVCELLHETRLSIADICQSLHFRDQASMARTFREVMGMTPLEYRAMG